MKKLGVIGGLGPMATVYFLQLITQMSDAASDQEHMEILVHSNPRIPDRTSYILGKSSENPLPLMLQAGKGLSAQGAELVGIPCVTAHYFHQELESAIGVPILNAPAETALCLKEAGVSKAGILATDGTVQCGLIQNALAAQGINSVLPDQEGQAAVMSLIYEDIKAGKLESPVKLETEAERLFARGAQVVLLGCTELSLVKRDFSLGPGYLDVLEVLARKAVLSCGRLKGEYRNLITE